VRAASCVAQRSSQTRRKYGDNEDRSTVAKSSVVDDDPLARADPRARSSFARNVHDCLAAAQARAIIR
jgi:hypothetical protein